jgi:SAM-dependent methyltransferase
MKDRVPDLPCKICGARSYHFASKKEPRNPETFHFLRCSHCQFVFVSNPLTDYAKIYNEDYYRGKGADPLIDYVHELEKFDATVRNYEWGGILQVVQSLMKVQHSTNWLDFGCGNGGLVKYVHQRVHCRITGFEEGWAAGFARGHGIKVLEAHELDGLHGKCDIVTSIEVMEHVEDPVAVLRRIHKLLRPGGLLFLTTGNAERHRMKFLRWGYVVPEIHISFYEPRTMALAMEKAGFRPEFRGFLPGFTGIIRYKVLKNLQLNETAGWERVLPWELLSRVVDKVWEVSAHPVGWRSEG